jgi:hypothetical protein
MNRLSYDPTVKATGQPIFSDLYPELRQEIADEDL